MFGPQLPHIAPSPLMVLAIWLGNVRSVLRNISQNQQLKVKLLPDLFLFSSMGFVVDHGLSGCFDESFFKVASKVVSRLDVQRMCCSLLRG